MERIVQIAETADFLVKQAGTRDPVEICHYKKCSLHYMDLKKRLKGYYFYQSRINNIVIDSNISEDFRPVLIAHELGHMMLHRERLLLMRCLPEIDLLEKNTDPMEYEANLFAAELLLEDDTILSLAGEYSFFSIAQKLYIPVALLDFKLTILEKKGYDIHNMQIGKSDFLKKEKMYM